MLSHFSLYYRLKSCRIGERDKTMNEIDAAIDRIERQIQGLQAQLTKLKEARDIAKGVLTGGYVATFDNQAKPSRKRATNKFTIADAAVQILKQKGEMHADEILEELIKTYEMEPSKPTLVSGLLRDKDKRFISLGNNRYRLNDTSAVIAPITTDLPSKPERRVKMGGLTDETRKAIKALRDEEFDVFDVIELLKVLNPPLAEMISTDRNKQASLSGTLKRLADDLKELEVVKRGKGSSPTIYKARKTSDTGLSGEENTSEKSEINLMDYLDDDRLIEKAS